MMVGNVGDKVKKLKSSIDTYMFTKYVSPIIGHIFKMQDNYCTVYKTRWDVMSKVMKKIIVSDIYNAFLTKRVINITDEMVVSEIKLCSMSYDRKLNMVERLYEYLHVGIFEFTERMFCECLCRIYVMHLLDYDYNRFDAVYLYNVNDMRSIGFGHLPRLKQLGYNLVKDKLGNVYYQKHHKKNIPAVHFKFEIYC
jgi:hypothetical protein